MGGTGHFDLREESAKAKLRDVWSRGHRCVELRQVPKKVMGKRTIFFCILCRRKCFTEGTLEDHIRGSVHNKRLEFGKSLFLDPPWPFNDGLLFFFNPSTGVARISYPRVASITAAADETVDDDDRIPAFANRSVGDSGSRVVSKVLVDGQISSIRIRPIGTGCISASFVDDDKIDRIWCDWLGDGSTAADPDHLSNVASCEFAIVIFSYVWDLGRERTTYESQLLSLAASCSNKPEDAVRSKKRKKCLMEADSLPEVLNEKELKNECETNAKKRTEAKIDRHELRRKICSTKKTCDICQHPILHGKDAAVLLNNKTGNLVCSSRNKNGAFHSFHVSCLIHWILVFECALHGGGIVKQKVEEGYITKDTHVSTIFCPECQGTGINIQRKKLERPTLYLETVFKYKLQAVTSNRAWADDFEHLETLKKSSTGLLFEQNEPAKNSQSEILDLKLLKFYRAEV